MGEAVSRGKGCVQIKNFLFRPMIFAVDQLTGNPCEVVKYDCKSKTPCYPNCANQLDSDFGFVCQAECDPARHFVCGLQDGKDTTGC